MKIQTTVELTAEDVTQAIAEYLNGSGLMLKDQDFDVHFRFVKVNGQDVLTTTVEIT